MGNITEITCRCLHCKKWFPSPISIGGDIANFDTSMIFSNITDCPHCGKMTGCNKENFRVRADDGGFLGSDT